MLLNSKSSWNPLTHYDVVIVGGGVVGLSMAASLASTTLRIAVLECGKLSTELKGNADFTDSCSLRVSTLNAASKKLLEALDVWQKIPPAWVGAFDKMHVFEALGEGTLDFDATESQLPYLGHVVPNAMIVSALLAQLSSYRNVDVWNETRLIQCMVSDEHVYLHTESSQQVSASLLIAADGRDSWVRNQLGFEVERKDYHQHGLVATVRTEKSHEKTAWQRFLPDGPLAFLPLADSHLSSIVWSVPTKSASHLKKLSAEAFNLVLTSAFANRLGQAEVLTPRVSFPLHRQQVNTLIQPRIALIGDAAHAMHPLAGQGLNLGLADVYELSKQIQIALDKKQDFSNWSVLRRYERARKTDCYAWLMLSDQILWFYQTTDASVIKTRGLGSALIKKSTWLKNQVLRFAGGSIS